MMDIPSLNLRLFSQKNNEAFHNLIRMRQDESDHA
jgi:hypothetical protein